MKTWTTIALAALLAIGAACTKPDEKDESTPKSIPSGMAGVPDIRILEVHATGSGPACGTAKNAKLKYKAMLADGKVVDPGAQPFSFKVGSGMAIRGWDVVVARMRVGDSWTVHIPYQLAYGVNGRPGIPPKTDMKFDMELLEVR